MLRGLILAAMILVTGCEGAAVGWGGTHQAVQANEMSVTYIYDALVGGYGATMRAATTHCGQYKKSPVPTMSGRQGVLYTQTFECR